MKTETETKPPKFVFINGEEIHLPESGTIKGTSGKTKYEITVTPPRAKKETEAGLVDSKPERMPDLKPSDKKKSRVSRIRENIATFIAGAAPLLFPLGMMAYGFKKDPGSVLTGLLITVGVVVVFFVALFLYCRYTERGRYTKARRKRVRKILRDHKKSKRAS